MTDPKRVTEKQLAANRANAQHSTGPRTPEGKAASRYNALTHGILARAVIPEALAPCEAQEAFEKVLDALTETFAPDGAVEELLVQQVAVAYWRLARLYRAEGGEIARRRNDTERDLALADAWAGASSFAGRLKAEEEALVAAMRNRRTLRTFVLARLPNLKGTDNNRIMQAAQQLLAEVREQRDALQRRRQAIEEASRSLPSIDTAIKYARYETALQNQLDRALSRLERLQRARTGDYVAPPLQIDVTGIEVPNDPN